MRLGWVMLAGSAVLAGASASAKRALPADVARFLDRREQCDHWMGEEPYDAERRREIEMAIRDLRCVTIERDARALRKRYAKSKDVLARLAD